MQAYVSVILIFVIYMIAGFLLGASPFQTYFPFLAVILGGIALSFIFVNGRRIKEAQTRIFWFIWIVLTTAPGILFIVFMKTGSKSFLFPWQLGIWGMYVPTIIIIVQIIYMVWLRIKGSRESNQERSQSS